MSHSGGKGEKCVMFESSLCESEHASGYRAGETTQPPGGSTCLKGEATPGSNPQTPPLG